MSWLTIALFNPEQWKLDEPFQLVFPKQEKGNSWVQFSLSAKNQPLWTANPTIKEFFQCSDYVWVDVVKVHQIFSAYAARQSAPWNSSLILKGTDLVKLLDWVKSKDKTLSEHLTRLSNIILLLSCLQLSGNWQCDKFSVSYERSLVWQVTFDYLYSSTPFESNSEIEQLVIKLKPGTWTKYFLNRDGQKKDAALCQLAYLQKSTLKIDSYHYRLAAKLALYLTVHSCSYPQGKFNILKLLERLGEDVQLLSTGKTQLWNDSLNKLKDLGWEIQLEGDNFPEPNARFIIKQPLDAGEKERLQVNKAKSSKSPLTGEQVREARLEKGRTLKQLEAEINPSLKEQDSTKNSSAKRKRPKIQLSYSKLSRIERGQLQIQPDDEQKLRKVLELD
jgi:hypothetical protein